MRTSRFIEVQSAAINGWGDLVEAVEASETWWQAREAVTGVLEVTPEESVVVLRMDPWSIELVSGLMPLVHDMGDQQAEEYSDAGPDHLEEYLDPDEAAVALGLPWSDVMRRLGQRHKDGESVNLEKLQTRGWFTRHFGLGDADVVLVQLMKLEHLCGDSRRRLAQFSKEAE